ncbi:MAG: 5-(carboxyamino)imidazole ribonucleotide synthase [Elusimicrobia bacterium]|nr:5-(carboxyamino)imidazole ribonucleotide synthase [Elusimicrobiota bacterium]
MILPGQTIGILGGGQLGRFLGLEARLMGFKTVVLDPTPDSPAAQVCDRHIQAAVDDSTAALELARLSDVVTLEWELIPAALLEKIEKVKPLFPSSKVIATISDRLVQKEFLKERGFPQTPFVPAANRQELEAATKTLGFPCVLKRRRHGYDGKGQLRLHSPADLPKAAPLLEAPCVLEALVSFDKEISVILAVGREGQTRAFPIAENVHRGGILHSTLAPASIPIPQSDPILALAEKVGRDLGHVGVMTVEMFVETGGRVLINEIAPRVHNSGHYTLGACATSQFEQHIRAVGGLPLGSTVVEGPVVMINLLGELWSDGEPRWDLLLAHPSVKLFLYGKAKAAPGRKMGHFLFIGDYPGGPLAEAERLYRGLLPVSAATAD